MVTPPDRPEVATVSQALRTPRSAAVAGIAFALLFGTVIVVVRLTIPASPNDTGEWLGQAGQRHAVLFALSLVPFAGIAFLWFIGVVRDRIGDTEDRFFATVFLGSGLLVVALMFGAAAVASGLITAAGADGAHGLAYGVWQTERHLMYVLLTDYAMRMASVFIIATSTILLRTGTGPRWLALYGYASAAVLLVGIQFLAWVAVIFPLWVLVISIFILVATSRRAADARGDDAAARPEAVREASR
jgi:hypothetical protein